MRHQPRHLTRPQRESLFKIFQRDHNDAQTYREFRRRVVFCSDYVMIPWCGMWLGIELDGYTHS